MDTILRRYRNLTILLVVLFAQLVLLAWQVKSAQDVPLVRVWAVTAVTPLARLLDSVRSAGARLLEDYVILTGVQRENRRLKEELGRLKLESQFLRSELATAERAQALHAFQQRTPSRTIAARVIGTGAGSNPGVVLVDRGASAGVQRGMAVITPDGIVGKLLAAYPNASQVLLVTDASFAAGVISAKHRVRGTLKGQSQANCRVLYIPGEAKVEAGEMFYTSGEDRIFPKGLPAGRVISVRDGNPFREVMVEPSGLQGGVEEVLIVLEGIHQEIPESGESIAGFHMLPSPGATLEAGAGSALPNQAPAATEADAVHQRYKALGEAQGHRFGEGAPGSRPPDFNLPLPAPSLSVDGAGQVAPPAGSQAPGAAPPASPAPTPAKPGVAKSAPPSASPD